MKTCRPTERNPKYRGVDVITTYHIKFSTFYNPACEATLTTRPRFLCIWRFSCCDVELRIFTLLLLLSPPPMALSDTGRFSPLSTFCRSYPNHHTCHSHRHTHSFRIWSFGFLDSNFGWDSSSNNIISFHWIIGNSAFILKETERDIFSIILNT